MTNRADSISRLARGLRGRVTLAALMVAMTGCAALNGEDPSRVSQAVQGLSFDPPPPGQPLPDGTARSAQRQGARPGAQVFPGQPQSQPAPVPPQSVQTTTDGVQLNFENADIRQVAAVVLGDVLKLNYVVEPSVQGLVTLSTSAPMSEDALLSALETALRINNAALVKDSSGYRIVPVSQAVGSVTMAQLGDDQRPLKPGFGLSIIPLRHVSATAAAQFLQPLIANPEDLRIDTARNLLLVSGTADERQTVIDTVSELDVDWLASRSVGIFPLLNTTPESVIPELNTLFGVSEAAAGGPPLFNFMAMTRLNAVLAITRNRRDVERVGQWVRRLDQGQVTGTQFYVHRLQYAAAADIATVLNDALGANSAGSASGNGSSNPNGVPGPLVGGPPDVSGLAPPTNPLDGSTGVATPGGAGAGAGGGENGGGIAVQAQDLTGVKIVPNPSNNSLLIRATPDIYGMIEATIRRMDTIPLQVLIQATIAEVTLNDALRFGVQYFFQAGNFGFGFNSTQSGNYGGIPLPQTTSPGFNFVYGTNSANVTIDALASITDVKVLSSPSVVVQDNKQAVLTVGDEVPVITRQSQSVDSTTAPQVNSIEYRDTGVILTVKPRINTNSAVSLEISQEVSAVGDSSSTAASTTTSLTPTISQRKINSTVNVQSGQTVVLGGLIQDRESKERSRIPLLGDIPILGALFGTTNNVTRRTELIVFITPRVIRDANDARVVSEELRAGLRLMRTQQDKTGSPSLLGGRGQPALPPSAPPVTAPVAPAATGAPRPLVTTPTN